MRDLQVGDAGRLHLSQGGPVGPERGGAVNQCAVFLQSLRRKEEHETHDTPCASSSSPSLISQFTCLSIRQHCQIGTDFPPKLATLVIGLSLIGRLINLIISITSEVCFCHSSLRIGAESSAERIAR